MDRLDELAVFIAILAFINLRGVVRDFEYDPGQPEVALVLHIPAPSLVEYQQQPLATQSQLGHPSA
ncbi:MAG: hypothetical protein UV49_C0029G0004 [candidate division WWE3 bacterium GW2011_GWA2_42_9]|nr:MAG: hypothetical protein UV49_C0029G0004 [candidate division WWE3 bacterium GW2011_GWA2_42_9]